MRLHYVALACLFIAAPAFADDAPQMKPPTLSLAGVPSGRYNIDPNHTNVIFSINHLGFSNYLGRFNKIDGTLMFSPDDVAQSAVKITIDINSIDTNNTLLETKLKDTAWFDAQHFSEASFTSTKIEKTSDHTAKITGDFSLRGVTRPLTLDVTFNGTGMNPFMKAQELGFSATGSFKRSDYGMKEYLGMVGDTVDLKIETEFLQAKE